MWMACMSVLVILTQSPSGPARIESLTKAREQHLRNAALNPTDPAAFHNVAAIDWLLASNGHDRDRLIDEGLRYVNIALSLDATYEHAMMYKNLLLREKAKWTVSEAEKTKLTEEADLWFNRALQARRNQQGGRPQSRYPNSISPPLPPPLPAPPPPRVRVNGSRIEDKVISRPTLVYPAAALQARIQGVVLLEVFINKDGTVERVNKISGHPMLVDAAIDYVSKSVFQPTLQNGVAINVVTTMTVTFQRQ